MFKKGNQLWKLADPFKVGRPPKYDSPESLWEAVWPFFEFIDENPIEVETNTVSDKGTFDRTEYKKRPYTWEALFVFLGVKDLDHYKTKKEFSAILSHIGNIIYANKFEGASVGVFNAMIIVRDLSLKDKSDITTGGEKINVPISKWSDS